MGQDLNCKEDSNFKVDSHFIKDYNCEGNSNCQNLSCDQTKNLRVEIVALKPNPPPQKKI